jgi:hypothetical protein
MTDDKNFTIESKYHGKENWMAAIWSPRYWQTFRRYKTESGARQAMTRFQQKFGSNFDFRFRFNGVVLSAESCDSQQDEPYSCNGGVHTGETFKDGTEAK